MSDEQEDLDFFTGALTRPPRGSVAENYDHNGGPPLMRLLLMQQVFQIISSFRWSLTKRTIVLFLVCVYLAFYDINNFFEVKNPNLYQLIGVDKNASVDQINERLDLANDCLVEATPEKCESFAYLKGEYLNKTEIMQIRFVLAKKQNLRELYDKTETFIRPRFEKSQYNPSQGGLYLGALSSLTFFSMYIIYLVFSIEKYQNFARQVVISSMLITGTILFQMRIPKEGNSENQVVQMINSFSLFQSLTLFELNYIIRNFIFPEIFSAALWMSRMIDKDPNLVVKERLHEAQKKVSRGLILCELITNDLKTRPEPVAPIKSLSDYTQLMQGEFTESAAAAVAEKPQEEDSDEAVPQEKKEKEEKSKLLDQFGKCDPQILKVYEIICKWRVADTVNFAENKLINKKKKEKEISPVKKIGRFISRILVIVVVAWMMYPRVQSIFEEMTSPETAEKMKTQQERMKKRHQKPKTAEEATEWAERKERQEREKQRKKEQEFDQIYEGMDL